MNSLNYTINQVAASKNKVYYYLSLLLLFKFIIIVVVLLSKQAIRNANDLSNAPRSFSSSRSWIRNSACIQISETMKSKKLSIYIRTIKITDAKMKYKNEVK